MHILTLSPVEGIFTWGRGKFPLEKSFHPPPKQSPCSQNWIEHCYAICAPKIYPCTAAHLISLSLLTCLFQLCPWLLSLSLSVPLCHHKTVLPAILAGRGKRCCPLFRSAFDPVLLLLHALNSFELMFLKNYLSGAGVCALLNSAFDPLLFQSCSTL